MILFFFKNADVFEFSGFLRKIVNAHNNLRRSIAVVFFKSSEIFFHTKCFKSVKKKTFHFEIIEALELMSAHLFI